MRSDLDLISIQLSENVSNFSSFETDFEQLIQHIKDNCPKAMIIVIDDFWVSGCVSIQKKSVANKYNAAFIPLDSIKGKEEFMCGIGTSISYARII